MNSFRSIQLSTEEKEALRGRLLKMESVTPILSDPKFCALIASLGVQQEVAKFHLTGTTQFQTSGATRFHESGPT